MLVKNGRVCGPDGLVEADVRIVGALVTRVGDRGGIQEEEGELVIDAEGCIVSPGLVDLHFHGCVGKDMCDGEAESLAAIARYQASRGVTAICPATMTYPEDKLAAVMDVARAFVPADDEASLMGVNMEGPFISPGKVGAQNPAYVQRCDIAMMRRLVERSGGLVKLVDIAPEEPGALDFIHEIAPDVRVSIAHTCADYDCAREAFAAGARQMTHLYNAMPGLHHRNPGPIAAAAERDDVVVEVIADGVHVHPAMVRLALRLFGGDRVALISDSMRACGLGWGTFDLGGQDVIVDGPVAKLPDGTIAGSVTDLASCVKAAVTCMGVDAWTALRCASYVPARALGITDASAGGYGRIEAGCQANIAIFDANMDVRDVIVRGKLL